MNDIGSGGSQAAPGLSRAVTSAVETTVVKEALVPTVPVSGGIVFEFALVVWVQVVVLEVIVGTTKRWPISMEGVRLGSAAIIQKDADVLVSQNAPGFFA